MENGKLYYGDGTNVTGITQSGNATKYYNLPAGSYYLASDIALPKTIYVNGNVNLCLNGKSLTNKDEQCYGLIEIQADATLNICDCQGNGKVEFNNTGSRSPAITFVTNVGNSNEMNLYGGQIVSDSTYTIDLGTANSSNCTIAFRMYGGEVKNTNTKISSTSAAVHAQNTNAFAKSTIEIYGGTITCEKGYGIDASSDDKTQILIAGGTIQGGDHALHLLGNLTLSGSPQIQCIGDDDIAIDITTTNVAETEQDYVIVKDDFLQAPGTTISVSKPVSNGVPVLIAKPEGNASSLADKAQYFISAEDNHFVEIGSDGLYLNACAITGQPTATNQYTVTATGHDSGSKLAYQWFSAKRDEIPVTEKTVMSCKNLSYGGFEGEEHWSASGGEVSFTLAMKAGDVLTLLFSQDHLNMFGITIDKITISDDSGDQKVEKGESDMEEIYDPENPLQTQKKCTLTVPADGNYTLNLSYSGSVYDGPTFTATVTAEVPDKALDNQIAATLNTEGLPSGSYICQVTWEGKSTQNSQAVHHTVPHTHNWVSAWTGGTTHHWHECEAANCTITEDSQKDGYAAHSGGTATCTAKAVCTVCNHEYGDLAAHNFDTTTWGYKTASGHAHLCKTTGCSAHDNLAAHTPGAAATEDNPQTCTTCGYELAPILAHTHVWGTWTSNGNGTHTRTCTKENSHTETVNCSGGTATCQAKAVCDICNTAYGTLGSHNPAAAWSKDTSGHWHACQTANCSEKLDFAAHTPGAAATATTPQTCTACGYVIKAATGTTTSGGGSGYTPSPSPGKNDSNQSASTSVTVPVSGEDKSVQIDAAVSGTTATIENVYASKLDTVIGNDVKVGTVTIDFSGLNKEVNAAKLPADVVARIAAAANDPNNDTENLKIVFTDNTSIVLDAKTLGAKSAQGTAADLTISIKSTTNSILNTKQQKAVGSRPALDINLTSAGKQISDMGGEITISAPYRLHTGEKSRGIVVYYVNEQGKKMRCETSYDPAAKQVSWKTDHLSVYMIGYDKSKVTPAKKPTTGKNTTAAVTYTVKRGDTLHAIARKYNTRVSKIVAANSKRIKNPNLIYSGWKLKIPQNQRKS